MEYLHQIGSFLDFSWITSRFVLELWMVCYSWWF